MMRRLLKEYPQECFEYVNLTQGSIDLANGYVAEKAVSETSLDDCRHIAIAIINKE